MSERENILGRIREALRVNARKPGSSHGQGSSPIPVPASSATMRALLPRVGETVEERLELFARNASDLKTELKMIDSSEDLVQQLAALRDESGWTKIATH